MENFSIVEVVKVPASRGNALVVKEGDILEIIDLDGKQVGDLMAWVYSDTEEYFSPAHTLTQNWSIALAKDSVLATNRRRVIFKILHDDVGCHDILVPCCDHEAYVTRYGLEGHRSCLSNIKEAVEGLGRTFSPRAEMAWNIFMNNEIKKDGSIVYNEPAHAAGSKIVLSCELAAVVALSACPQDQTPTNGWNCSPMEMRLWRSD